MNDPYVVLGVSQNATDDEIKNAYREKAKKYSEDNYSGHMAEVAAKKMQELDDAYDEIISQKRTGSSSYNPGAAYNTNTYTQGSYTTPTYAEIREKIKKNDLDSAQNMLNNVPEQSRIAEWFYLQGVIQQRKGWTNAAYQNYERAYQTDSSNPEYAKAYQSMNNQRSGGYRTTGREAGNGSDCSFCNFCQGLICADCCCECFGGDLIPCC